MYYPIIDREMFMNHLPLYIFLFSLLIFTIIFLYIKLTYPFWNTQPVFHTYDFWRYWVKSPFPIQYRYPVKTKYCNFKNVETVEYLEATDSQKKDFINLLQCYYIPDENALFVFNLENLDAYMTGHSYPSYLSFYKEDFYTTVGKNPIITDSTVIDTLKKPVGCISARTIDILFSKEQYMKAYYWEFICIKREKADKYLSRQLIQTQEYRQRQQNMDFILASRDPYETPISASIFKKEVDLCEGIVSLVEYDTKICVIRNEPLKKLPPHFVLIEIGGENIDLLIDFLEISKTNFEVFGLAEISNLVGLIQKRLLMVYCIQKAKDVYAAYFFRDSRTQYDGKGVMICLCGSINNCNSLDLFYMGFLQSLRAILKKIPLFQLLSIENISNSSIIYERYGGELVGNYKSAYYLYNYVVPKQPFLSGTVFLVF
jgi:hypothetical protein